jgi:hypothetical protein
MKRATFISILVVVGALVVGTLGVQRLQVDEKEYKSTAKMTKLIESEPLSGLPGQVANVFVAEMPGGWLGGRQTLPSGSRVRVCPRRVNYFYV